MSATRKNQCTVCGTEMTSRRENRRYSQSGLDGVTLCGLEIYHCPKCGEEEEVIPNIEKLHQVLAFLVATKKPRLTPKEIRFLRTYLGLSSTQFANRMGVAKETVSRWEKVEDPLGMKTAVERLLRLMALNEKPIDHYPAEKLDETATEDARPVQARLKSEKDEWKECAA